MAEDRPPTAPRPEQPDRTTATATATEPFGYLVREALPGINARGMPTYRYYASVTRPTRNADGDLIVEGWLIDLVLPHPYAAAIGFRVVGPFKAHSIERRARVGEWPSHLKPPRELLEAA